MTKRPLGIILVQSYFLTFVVVISLSLIADVDFFTRASSELNPHFFDFFAGSSWELSLDVLSVFALLGLQRMRPWSRWLAIILAGINAVVVIWFYSVVLIFRLWTLIPHHAWPNVKGAAKLGLALYVACYLLQPKARHLFQPPQPLLVERSNGNW